MSLTELLSLSVPPDIMWEGGYSQVMGVLGGFQIPKKWFLLTFSTHLTCLPRFPQYTQVPCSPKVWDWLAGPLDPGEPGAGQGPSLSTKPPPALPAARGSIHHL